MAQQDHIDIEPVGPVKGRIRPPGSKSITNRALVCGALAAGRSVLRGALYSDDTRMMIDGLERLGIGIDADPRRQRIIVAGSGGKIPSATAALDVGNSGTTARFLAAMVTLGSGEYRIDGVPRMRERPIGDLLEALQQLGASAVSELDNGCPPLLIRAHGLRGGKATIPGDVSSQFLSGLLMASPYAQSPVELSVAGKLVSQPYVRMTLGVMEAFGVEVEEEGLRRFVFSAGRSYQAREFDIEPDASAASYFFAAAAITGGEVTVYGLSRHSVQGDVAFVDLLAQMGCQVDDAPDAITVRGGPLRAINADMNAFSDTVQTLAAVALFARGTTTIGNVAHIRHKETDRIAALATELRKLGATVEEREDGLSITPGQRRSATIATYNDHRMAMSLAMVGLKQPGVRILDPLCTAKTYPGFFEDLRRVTQTRG